MAMTNSDDKCIPAGRYRRAGFLAGLSAGALTTAVMFVLNRGFGAYSLAEAIAYRLIALLPLSFFSFGVETLGGNAKQLMLLIVMVVQVLVCGLLGLLWASLAMTLPGEERPDRRMPALWKPGPSGGLFYALMLFLLAEIFLLPSVGDGFLGVAAQTGVSATALTLGFEAVLYGLSLAFFYRLLLTPAGQPVTSRPLTRRDFVQRAIFGLAALVIGGAAVSGLTRRSGAAAQSNGRIGNDDLPPEITPNGDFYKVSKNFADPHVSQIGWSLQIAGLVTNPYSLTFDEIRAMPAITDYRTLTCISNEIGGDLISNAAWKGVRLKDLLERAGVRSDAVDLMIGASDGYTESFPIAKALTPDVLAVYEMNGARLPDEHGFPLRLLVPDIYGMKNVKWVNRLEPVSSDFKGFWEEQGWSDIAKIKTMSRFDYPRDRDILPTGRNQAGGVSFAGARGIQKVEVTVDGGKTWTTATLRKALGQYTWVLWTAEVDLSEGQHTLMVRATDGAGQTQTDRPAPPLPDGASGWHTITVRAAPGVPAPSVPTPSAPTSGTS
jgi:DMSO/TMAO reductase YedYZ molybdopterin-dependent catalytic subunit